MIKKINKWPDGLECNSSLALVTWSHQCCCKLLPIAHIFPHNVKDEIFTYVSSTYLALNDKEASRTLRLKL